MTTKDAAAFAASLLTAPPKLLALSGLGVSPKNHWLERVIKLVQQPLLEDLVHAPIEDGASTGTALLAYLELVLEVGHLCLKSGDLLFVGKGCL